MMPKVSDLFDVFYGANLEFNKMTPLEEGGIPFVARGSSNNGVVGYVASVYGAKKNPAYTISVAGSGSILECFLQEVPYYSGRDLYYLKPKQPITKNQMLFYCAVLRSNKYRYSYGRQANRTLGDIAIPALNELPKWVNETIIPTPPSEKPYQNKFVSLKDRKWDWFNLKDIFPTLEKCKCSNASVLLADGDDINYIGAKKTDNGVMQRVKKVNWLVSKGNAMVFIGDGAGSVGYVTYQKDDFIGSSTLTCGYSEHLNEYTGLFLVSILDLERYRFSFGRKYGKRQIKNMKIKLPATSYNEPDWEFMEYYIKSLPYSSNLKNMIKDNKGLTDSQLIEKYESGKINLKEATKKMLQPSPTINKSEKQTTKKR